MTFSEKRSDQLAIAGLLVLAALFVYLLSVVFGWGAINQSDNLATIVVSGEGRAFAIPDTATFTYTVQAEAADARTAQEQIASAAKEISEQLQASGVEESDIKTQSYNVYPRYEYRRISDQTASNLGSLEIATYPVPEDRNRVLVGYEATQTNQVRVRNLDAAGNLLSLVTDNGADNVSQLDFTVWDESAVEAEARSEAIADAKVKASELAKQLDVNLGDIISFEEVNYGYEPMFARMEMAASDSTAESVPAEIAVGQNEIRKTVNITFELD